MTKIQRMEKINNLLDRANLAIKEKRYDDATLFFMEIESEVDKL
jgi:hypothetical protein